MSERDSRERAREKERLREREKEREKKKRGREERERGREGERGEMESERGMEDGERKQYIYLTQVQTVSKMSSSCLISCKVSPLTILSSQLIFSWKLS